MLRFAARISLLLILFTASLTAIHVLAPGHVPPVFGLGVLDTGECQMPCWSGIRPGITTMKEAVLLVHNNPYVDPSSIKPATNEGISFTACWKQPEKLLHPTPLDTSDLCILIINEAGEDVVGSIFLHVNVPFGDFVTRFGPPARSVVGILPSNDFFYVLEYPQLGMEYDSFADCRSGQHMINVVGRTYVLQPADRFVPQTGLNVVGSWSGFNSQVRREIMMRAGC